MTPYGLLIIIDIADANLLSLTHQELVSIKSAWETPKTIFLKDNQSYHSSDSLLKPSPIKIYNKLLPSLLINILIVKVLYLNFRQLLKYATTRTV